MVEGRRARDGTPYLEARFLAAFAFVTQNKIMAPQDHAAAIFVAQLIDDIGQALLGIVVPRRNIQRQSAVKTAVVKIGEFKGDETQTDTPFPGFAQEQG